MLASAQPPIVPSGAALAQGILDNEQSAGFLDRQVNTDRQFIRPDITQRLDWLACQTLGQHAAGGYRMRATEGLEGNFTDQAIVDADMKDDLGAVFTLPGRTAQCGLEMPGQRSNVLWLHKIPLYDG